MLVCGEQIANMLGSFPMARRPDSRKSEVLSEKDLKDLRHNLAHLSVTAVQDFYERAYQDCRLVYNRLPTPRQMQTLVQVWKQLWKWR
jgi:uracil-DNA glycosylase